MTSQRKVRTTADTRVLAAAVADLVRREFKLGFNYAKAGVMLQDLQPASHVTESHEAPSDLFTDATDPSQATLPGGGKSRPTLMAAMDALNHRFGRDSVRLGSTVLASNGTEVASWSTKQERRSQRFTTVG